MRVNRQDFLSIRSLIEKGSITQKKFKNKEIVSALKANGAVKTSNRGSIRYINLLKEENIYLLLKSHGYNIDLLADIGRYIENIYDKKPNRATIQEYSNDTKTIDSKSMSGLYVASLENVEIRLDGEAVSILPNDGLGYFFFHTQKVEVSEHIIIVGVENYQVAWFSKRYEALFQKSNILFVVTTPYMLEWISTLENEYIHFGDYDLAGVNIYLNKVLPRLKKSKKHSMFIPENIETLIEKYGNSKLYEKQKQYANLRSDEMEVNRLVKSICKFKKGFEQESLSQVYGSDKYTILTNI